MSISSLVPSLFLDPHTHNDPSMTSVPHPSLLNQTADAENASSDDIWAASLAAPSFPSDLPAPPKTRLGSHSLFLRDIIFVLRVRCTEYLHGNAFFDDDCRERVVVSIWARGTWTFSPMM
ncbi:hypothetical protein E4T38_04139 [Aureobasidium subglaciale]|nr:hypothetical protein E4T38_04139 [Aureobasidium subglaciale]KAI5224550.1 hypothetical protein E4T40_04050 [Aureobasidium subglaciale]KAI5227802.1 hypothetical protein E4T41_04270 [Aureobasidium subglaciale]KAI5263210.1 hypothetical protein E4T46_03891 [Aureobasidium subglaciale]